MNGKRRRGWRGRVLGHEQLESRSLLAGLAGSSPWQNPLEALDLDADGSVTPTDALVAINSLNSGQSGALAGKMTPPALAGTATGTMSTYCDADGDGSLTPTDALMVIDSLNAGQVPAETDPLPTADQQPDQIGDGAQAVDVSSGFAKVRAELNTNGDVDVFSVVPTAAVLSVALFTRVDGSMTVSVVNANGDVLATASTADAADHHPATTEVDVDTGSTYYIVVSGGDGVTGKYGLQVLNYEEGKYPAPGSDPPGGGSHDGTHPAPLPPDQLFAKLDADSDGSLTLDEFKALTPPPGAKDSPETVFAALDTDGNGSLSLDEFEKGAPPPPVDHGSGDSTDDSPPPSRTTLPLPPTPANLFAKLDTDADGSLSLTEFAAAPRPDHAAPAADAVFAAWDTDRSGLLSLDEFATGLASVRRK